jgi:hypothetical protein
MDIDVVAIRAAVVVLEAAIDAACIDNVFPIDCGDVIAAYVALADLGVEYVQGQCCTLRGVPGVLHF